MAAVIDAARDTLVGAGPDRPVGRFQTETALKQLPGVVELIDEALGGRRRHATDPAVPTRPRLEAAPTTAKAALAAFERT